MHNLQDMESLLIKEIDLYKSRTVKSSEYFERAKLTCPAGVASCYQRWDWMLFYSGRYPFYVEENGGSGSTICDVDGNKLIDFHQGKTIKQLIHETPFTFYLLYN